MLGDAQLDACEAQLRSFRMMDGQYYETLHELLRKYEALVEDYRMLRSDYEEEKENREKYKRQARGQEKNPFVLLLVDGDGYIFKDHLIKNMREGGISAAQLLTTEIRDRLRKMGSLDHCRIVVRIYCNLAQLSHALGRQGLCGLHARAIAPVAAAFTGAKDHFDFVDVGENPGGVGSKIEESFRLFADSGQCKHVFFAGCHDPRYLPLLSPFLGKSDRVTLIRAPAQRSEYQSLALPIDDFASVFRDSALPGWNPGAASPVNARPNPQSGLAKTNGAAALKEISSSSSLNGDIVEDAGSQLCAHFIKKGWCKFGKGCKFSHPQKGPEAPEIPQPKTKSKDMAENWRDTNAFADDWGNNVPEPSNADLPRPSAETEGLIPVNKYGDRLDFYLPRPTAEEYAIYNAMVKEPGKKPCNDYQLKGHCPSLAVGIDCEYDHNPLSPELFHVLKVIVQGYPCQDHGACRKSDCFNGHVCQRPGCRGQFPCKFKNDYRAHNLDPKVAEW
ncbi:hypothetical protein B0J12DRAFT_557363, partial [Macrophomina phaseolina]